MTDVLRKIISGSLLSAWAMAAIGLMLLCMGSLTVPLAGWGAAYVAAGGLWLLVASAAPILVWVVAVTGFRIRQGFWYLGVNK
jgi:hypothetical protein